MDLQLQIKMNPDLYLRDPESSKLGKSIIQQSIKLIGELGFEDFTFKKLAAEVSTTEASVYRYFENKHKLLNYLTSWFWTWLEYQVIFHTNNINDPKTKIDTVIRLITFQVEDKFLLEHINKDMLYQIVVAEGSKAYLTKHVAEDNKSMFFKPYKDLCHRIAEIFLEYNGSYKYPHSLASTLMETTYHQIFFKDYLPKLTDFGKTKGQEELIHYLNHLTYAMLDDVQK